MTRAIPRDTRRNLPLEGRFDQDDVLRGCVYYAKLFGEHYLMLVEESHDFAPQRGVTDVRKIDLILPSVRIICHLVTS